MREQAQKEGWAKASKLQSRPMSQGLIGIAVSDKSAAVVEVSLTHLSCVCVCASLISDATSLHEITRKNFYISFV